MAWKGAKWTETLLVLAVFSLLFFAARLPLFSMGWDGQDANGHDADMFVHQPVKPDYFLLARLGGKDIYLPTLGHPAPIYAMYVLMGKIGAQAIDYRTLSDHHIIVMLKIIAALFQLAIWLPLLWLIARSCPERTARGLGYFAILAYALSPIAIQATNEFQMDSMFGFVMAGGYALALLIFDRNTLPLPASAALVAIAAAFLGLGKNEWSLVLTLACFGSVVLLVIAVPLGYLRKQPSQRFLVCLCATMVGLTLGNLASYLFEPTFYNSGWDLLARMVRGESIASKSGRDRFIEISRERLDYIQVHLFLIGFIGWRLVARRSEISPVIVLASLFGLGLFAAFFISTWGVFPRYFAPALAVLCIVSTWLFIEQPVGRAATALGAAAFVWFAVAGVRYARKPALAQISVHGTVDVSSWVKPGCATLMPVEDAYRRKDVDFVHTGMGYEGAAEIAGQFGGRLCPH
jgi:hypothetical protein